ncbi:MAG: class I SAM-dependent methyltransferase [Candidatus Tectomicrobia bacterium]|uniref:Class I SAM-dependent methyltransferase n=1 Tax=Tectimicrobiota bacterium TaxID=2528274 RepID=A0A932M0X4_UNCTE|nr:class I SAM-dependent methyltransferase [Candidatus Tectomicrobia bacterium]
MSVAPPVADIARCLTRTPVGVRTLTADFRGRVQRTDVHDFIGGPNHYSRSFGIQWTKYRNVQIDRLNGTRASYNHLRLFTQGDVSMLDGMTCLEIGSGAGRFTDYLVDLCRTVITVDPSPALFVNVALGAPNLIACRADLFDVPVRRDEIDVVFCRGVIQHTRNPREAIKRLFDYVRPGGSVLFDVYALKWYTPFLTKYWLRPLTRRIPPERFMALAEHWVPRFLEIKHRVVNRALPRTKLGRNIANQLIPIADFSEAEELGPWSRRVEWSVLDTVDMYTPRYDRPMTFGAILRAIEEVGAREVRADRSSFCFRAVAPG